MQQDHRDMPTKVLVVDDDPLLGEIVVSRLRTYAYDVSYAENGKKALEYLVAHPVDLIISDLDMPVMNGYEFIYNVRKHPETRHIPIIVITGSEDGTACERALSFGATAFLTKPVNWTLFNHNLWYVLNNSRREQSIRAARVEAESASRQKDNMISVISHELKTPLNAIIGFSQLLLDQVAGPLGHPDYNGYAQEIEQAGRAMERLVSDILLYSGILGGTRQLREDDYTVETIVVPPLRQFAPKAQAKQIRLDCVLDQPFADVACDRALMRKAIEELVENAITAAPPASTILVAAKTGRRRFELTVTDRGPGIPEQQRDQVFDAFFQIESPMTREKNGIGLGLTIAREIARAHGGDCIIEAAEGGGTTVRFTIADRSGEAASPAARSVA